MIWGNCGKTFRDKWQRLQNRAARVLSNSNYDADARILLNDLGWQNLETQRKIQKAVMVYKSLNCLAPDHMSSNSYHAAICLILKISLLFPCHEPITIEIASATAGVFLRNNLPTDVRQAISLTCFRKLLTSSANTAFH